MYNNFQNFKEKINIIENENRKQVDGLEAKYKKYTDTLTNSYETKIKEIEKYHQEYQKDFDENYIRFQNEINFVNYFSKEVCVKSY